MNKITLSVFKSKFLNDIKAKYELNESFCWISGKQEKN